MDNWQKKTELSTSASLCMLDSFKNQCSTLFIKGFACHQRTYLKFPWQRQGTIHYAWFGVGVLT